MFSTKKLVAAIAAPALVMLATAPMLVTAKSGSKLDDFQAHTPIHVYKGGNSSHGGGGTHGGNGGGGGVTNPTPWPSAVTPSQVRAVYGLPSTGGTGTIAIIDAYGDPTAESDLNTFSSEYSLASCTAGNGCFEQHAMSNHLRTDAGWSLETSLDIEWAHAVAPNARILLVEAKSSSGSDLMAAVDYARSRADVTAVSMSWGGAEFSTEASYDTDFTSAYGASFFAASGDNGTGASWPASSPNVTSVGGTSLAFNADGSLASETAWSGSGGGVSAYEPLPAYQSAFGIATPGRSIPDVAANADPNSGYSIYDSTSYNGQSGWFQVGGTSGSTPVWAGIKALGGSADNGKFYPDAASSYAAYFRDITSGSNGTCGTDCTAAPGYDLVTGLGSPVAAAF